MAKQKGIIKLEGKLGDLSFLKTRDGYMAREKGGVDASKIQHDPAFARTRENNKEFSTAATAGKLVRDAVRPLLLLAGDPRVTSRMTQVMASIKNLDMTSDRGKRSVANGITDPIGKALLKGFNFNERSRLSGILFNRFTVNTATGEISMSDFVTATGLKALPSATHVGLTAGWARVDFSQGTQEAVFSPALILPVESSQINNIDLTPAGEPSNSGTDLFLLLVEFFQEVNGVTYSLKNGAYNVLTIVEVL